MKYHLPLVPKKCLCRLTSERQKKNKIIQNKHLISNLILWKVISRFRKYFNDTDTNYFKNKSNMFLFVKETYIIAKKRNMVKEIFLFNSEL